jgi:hypothetical protein
MRPRIKRLRRRGHQHRAFLLHAEPIRATQAALVAAADTGRCATCIILLEHLGVAAAAGPRMAQFNSLLQDR